MVDPSKTMKARTHTATCVPGHQQQSRAAMDFDLVLRDARLPDSQAGSADRRYRREGRAHRRHRLGARRRRQGAGAGGRPAGLLGLRRNAHPSRQVLHPGPLRPRTEALPASGDGAGLGREAHLHGRGRDRTRRRHHREVHLHGATRMRHPCRGRSQGRAARPGRREGPDRPLYAGRSISRSASCRRRD